MYTIDQIAMMTGLTTRTVRNYIKADILHGDKAHGIWTFSDDQVQEFITHPSVQPSIRAKHHAIIYDFLAEYPKSQNETCVMLDLNVKGEQAEEISRFFCDEANHSEQIRFSFSYHQKTARVFLKGPEVRIKEIMDKFYLR